MSLKPTRSDCVASVVTERSGTGDDADEREDGVKAQIANLVMALFSLIQRGALKVYAVGPSGLKVIT